MPSLSLLQAVAECFVLGIEFMVTEKALDMGYYLALSNF